MRVFDERWAIRVAGFLWATVLATPMTMAFGEDGYAPPEHCPYDSGHCPYIHSGCGGFSPNAGRLVHEMVDTDQYDSSVATAEEPAPLAISCSDSTEKTTEIAPIEPPRSTAAHEVVATVENALTWVSAKVHEWNQTATIRTVTPSAQQEYDGEGDAPCGGLEIDWDLFPMEPLDACPESKGVTREPRMLDIELEFSIDEELGRLQRRYREFRQQGLCSEADRIALRILRSIDRPEAIPVAQPRRMRWDSAVRTVDHVAKPTKGWTMWFADMRGDGCPTEHTVAKPIETAWTTAAEAPISFHFRDASIDEVADFFRGATGMAVMLDLTESEYADPSTQAIHVRCRGRNVEQSLRVVLGTCGLGYFVTSDDMIVIAGMDRLDRLAANPSEIGWQACWSPGRSH